MIMRHVLRSAGGLTLAFVIGASGAASASAAPPRAPAAGFQTLAKLTQAAAAFSDPDSGSTPIETVSRTRPITGERTTLPVIATATDPAGNAWLEVLLPGRPNSHTGWISGRSATLGATGWALRIRTSDRVVSVLYAGRRVRSFSAVVGKTSTPTPIGRFFVEESVKLTARAVGAPYALALSARSNVLQEFAGGPGQIALHGINNVGGVVGTAASHGCIRLDTQAITWLADHIPPGTPVTITR
jgi:lipoprotein-anchoring transpeptidase ErfK/SrfK